MKQAQKEEEGREFRHVPYFATTSFRHLALELPDEIAVTRLTAETKKGERNDLESDKRLGLEIYEVTSSVVKLNYRGSGLDMLGVLEKFDSEGIHDAAIDTVRFRVDRDDELIDAVSQKWLTPSGRYIPLDEANIPVKDSCYVDFVSKKVPAPVWEDLSIRKAPEGTSKTFGDFWTELNRCEVCERPLEIHGIEHRTLNAKHHGLEIPWINHTFPKEKRPLIDTFDASVAKWVFHTIIKPSGLASPSGMFGQRKDREERWVTESA